MFHCVLIADFTVKPLAGPLMAGTDPVVKAHIAPFDQVVPVLVDGGHAAWRHGGEAADTAVVWTLPQKISPGFAALLDGQDVDFDSILADIRLFTDAVKVAAGRMKAVLLPNWVLPAWRRGHGPLEWRGKGAARLLARMNLALAEQLDECPNVHVLDTARWLAAVGPDAWDQRLWHVGKIPFSANLFRYAARELRATLRGLAGRSRKLLVLDLDDTLWGGTVGDIGWENLALGGHDPVGEALVRFQEGLRALSRRGIMLAVVSKNTEAVALEAIDNHPEMVLRRDSFTGWRINWQDKASNIVDLVKELNIGLDSVVFIDNEPAERARVSEALPMVLVPDWPVDKLLYYPALEGLDCFDNTAISREDAERTLMYRQEAARRQDQTSVTSKEEWLSSLGLVVTLAPLDPNNIKRATQLLNKTNQMNLTTRRLSESELADWQAGGDREVLTVSVDDRFGAYGLTGLISLEYGAEYTRIVDFVLSCRVMGRGVEKALLHAAIHRGAARGCALWAQPVPTERNAPCLDFFAQESGLHAADSAWTWPAAPYPLPEHITLVAGESPE